MISHDNRFNIILSQYTSDAASTLWRANAEPLLKALKPADFDISQIQSSPHGLELGLVLFSGSNDVADGGIVKLFRGMCDASAKKLKLASQINLLDGLERFCHLEPFIEMEACEIIALCFDLFEQNHILRGHVVRVIKSLSQIKNLRFIDLFNHFIENDDYIQILLDCIEDFPINSIDLSPDLYREILKYGRYRQELYDTIYQLQHEPIILSPPSSIPMLQYQLLRLTITQHMEVSKIPIQELFLHLIGIQSDIKGSFFELVLKDLNCAGGKIREDLLHQNLDILLLCSFGPTECRKIVKTLLDSQAWAWIRFRPRIFRKLCRLLALWNVDLETLSILDIFGKSSVWWSAIIGHLNKELFEISLKFHPYSLEFSIKMALVIDRMASLLGVVGLSDLIPVLTHLKGWEGNEHVQAYFTDNLMSCSLDDVLFFLQRGLRIRDVELLLGDFARYKESDPENRRKWCMIADLLRDHLPPKDYARLASITTASETDQLDELFETLMEFLSHDHDHVIGYSSCCVECYCD